MGKGAETRERIVKKAMALASRDGLAGVTIGALASETHLSKSGLFAHFGSKEELQLTVLDQTALDFTESVLKPALASPRGVMRLAVFFDRWLDWAQDRRFPGGCLMIAASAELDDRPGPQRDRVESHQRSLVDSIARMAHGAVDEGQFRADLDCKQFAHDVYALYVGYHQLRRLLRDRNEGARVRASFDRLVEWARRRE